MKTELSPQGTIADAIRDYLRKFIVYPDAHSCIAHVLWILHCYFMDKWDSTPRLLFTSVDAASGKTRALECTEKLVPNPVSAFSATAAYINRKIADEDNRPTILFDEIDTIFGKKASEPEDLRGVLNAGHRRGATAGRCVVVGNEIKTIDLPAYAAVAMGGLGFLPDTIMRRSIVIKMKRRKSTESIRPFRMREQEKESASLKSKIQDWAEHVCNKIVKNWPEMPDGVEDRDADVWEPLLAVADALGGDWPVMAREAAVAMVNANKERQVSLGIQLLSDIRKIFGSADRIHRDTLLSRLVAIEESPWSDLDDVGLSSKRLTSVLKEYDIPAAKMVTIGGRNARGYWRENFSDAWERNLAPISLDKNGETSETDETITDKLSVSHA